MWSSFDSRTALCAGFLPRTSASAPPRRCGFTCSSQVAAACGSRSQSRTSRPTDAACEARLTAVVVFPTPPLVLYTAITVAATTSSLHDRLRQHPGGRPGIGQNGAGSPIDAKPVGVVQKLTPVV